MDTCSLPPTIQALIAAVLADATRLDALLGAAGDGQADVTLHWSGRKVAKKATVTVR